MRNIFVFLIFYLYLCYMNKLKLIYKVTTSPIIKKLIEDGDELSAWQCIYGGTEDKDLLRIIYVSDEELYNLSKGIKKEYYDNGLLYREYGVNENGKRDGLYRRWFDSGQLAMEGTYKDGEYHGLYRRGYENGQLREEYGINEDGEKDGLYRRWFSNGQLCEECTYKDGKLDGLYRSWWDNGQLDIKTIFKDGLLDGLCREWYSNGKLREECVYKNGIKIKYK